MWVSTSSMGPQSRPFATFSSRLNPNGARAFILFGLQKQHLLEISGHLKIVTSEGYLWRDIFRPGKNIKILFDRSAEMVLLLTPLEGFASWIDMEGCISYPPYRYLGLLPKGHFWQQHGRNFYHFAPPQKSYKWQKTILLDV